MNEMINRYLLAIDELNLLTATSYYISSKEHTESKIEQIIDDILSFFVNAYHLGIEHASIMLNHDLIVHIDDMEEAIYVLIDGKDFRDRIIDHILNKNLQGLQTLTESEFHRIYNTAILDGAKQYHRLKNIEVTKTWKTVCDEKVRDTHIYLEGMNISIRNEFFTYDGDHTYYPGGFKNAENNVNCRCMIVLSTN